MGELKSLWGTQRYLEASPEPCNASQKSWFEPTFHSHLNSVIFFSGSLKTTGKAVSRAAQSLPLGSSQGRTLAALRPFSACCQDWPAAEQSPEDGTSVCQRDGVFSLRSTGVAL